MTTPDDLDYFRRIEEAFIRLRGSPLLLTPADWKTAMRWRELGMSAHFVVGALEEVFARRRERGAEERKVNSLRYCARQVEKAWTETRELLGPSRKQAPAIDVAERLDDLTVALPKAWRHSEEIGAGVANLSGDDVPGDVETVERALVKLDSEMLARAASDLSEGDRERIWRRVRETLRHWSARLEPSELELLEDRLRSEEIRRHHSLPLLSLFTDRSS